jgi:hypothetical protein
MKDRGQECSMATGVAVRNSFIISGGFKRPNTGDSGARYSSGNSRLTCTELRDEETGRNFVLPFDRTTPRERLFSTLWPTATSEEPAVRMGAAAAAAGAADGWAPPDILALDSSRMAASTP